MLGSLYPCLVQNVDFGFGAPYVDVFCPCCSTWRRWVVDTFAPSDTSRLGSPDVFEGGGASFGCLDEWRVVVSWRGCVEDRKSVDRQYAGLYPVSCGAMPCRCALRCVTWLYPLSFSSTPCRLARVWRFSSSFGDSRCCLGRCFGRWVERWSVGLRNEGEKKHRLAHFLGPLSGSSFLSIDGPTSLGRGEGHLMCLSSVRVSSGGDGDDGGKYENQRSTVDLGFKLRSHAQRY